MTDPSESSINNEPRKRGERRDSQSSSDCARRHSTTPPSSCSRLEADEARIYAPCNMLAPVPFKLAPGVAAGRTVGLQLPPALRLDEQNRDPRVRDMCSTINGQRTACQLWGS